MFPVKSIFKILCLLIFLGLIINCKKKEVISKDCQELKDAGIVDDYDFKKNTSWANHDSYTDKLRACQIPGNVLREMCTIGLIETCLNYPYWVDVFAFDNVQYGYNLLFRDNFNGIQELYNRADAGIELLEIYKKMDPGGYSDTWSSIERGQLGWSIIYIELILTQDELILSLNEEQRICLLKESLKKYESKLDHIETHGIFGLTGSAYVLAHLMINMNFTPFIDAINDDQELQYFIETLDYHIYSDFINELNKIVFYANQLINLNTK